MNIIYIDGIPEEYDNRDYSDRNIHREDGPAIEVDGNKHWFLNGKHHRVDGPAIEWATGTKEWYLSGKHHRVDGPAIEHINGRKDWFLNGKRHRIDGPAIEDTDVALAWWIDGYWYSFEDFIKEAKLPDEQAILLALEWL
jgi:hypothetical protein